jgi:hypothetical protein
MVGKLLQTLLNHYDTIITSTTTFITTILKHLPLVPSPSPTSPALNTYNALSFLSAPPSCTEERKRVFKSIRERHLLRVGIFIPDCDADGSYSEMQCSQNKRLCWCVDIYGAEIDDTRVVAKRPDCRRKFRL